MTTTIGSERTCQVLATDAPENMPGLARTFAMAYFSLGTSFRGLGMGHRPNHFNTS